MVNYNPKEWIKLIFTLHKTDTVRRLAPSMLAFGLFTALVCGLDIDYFKNEHIITQPVVHSLLGFVISLLLVFRTNTAYERWWEGRKVWGALVNNTRNLAIKLSVLTSDNTQRNNFRVLITNYVFAMKEHLREGVKFEELEDCEAQSLDSIKNKNHVPNIIAQKLFEKLNELTKSSQISDEKLIVLNAEFQSLTDIIGMCERIKKTPIPYSYSTFLKKFIFFYTITMPFGFVGAFGYWSILVVMFVFYVLASLELIAEEIEDPFGTDPNDLPTDDISETIKKNLIEIFENKN